MGHTDPLRSPGASFPGVRDEPPAGVDVTDVGTLLTGEPKSADLAALLVRLAVDGYLTVEPADVSLGWGPFRTEQRTWRLRRTALDAGGLDPQSRTLYTAVFGDRSETTLLDAKRRIARVRGQIFGVTRARARERRWCRTAVSFRVLRALVAVGFVIFFGSVVLGMAGLRPNFALTVLGWGIIAIGVVGSMVHRRSGARLTEEGRRLGEDVEQFAAYLSFGDASRLRGRDGAARFSRYLPWAVATGTAAVWGETFATVARAQAAGDPAVLRSWAADLSWYPLLAAPLFTGTTGSSTTGFDVSGSYPADDDRAGFFDGVGDAVSDMGTSLGDAVSDLGSSLSDFGSSIEDFASQVGDFASDVGDMASDFGDAGGSDSGSDSGGDSGGGDSGGGDSGGGGGGA